LFTRQEKSEQAEEEVGQSTDNTQDTEAEKYDDESRRSEDALAEKTRHNKKETEDEDHRKQRKEEDACGLLSLLPSENVTSHGTHIANTITKEVQSHQDSRE